MYKMEGGLGLPKVIENSAIR